MLPDQAGGLDHFLRPFDFITGNMASSKIFRALHSNGVYS